MYFKAGLIIAGPKPDLGSLSFIARSDLVVSCNLSPKMEKIISNPGLQHLAEKVFWNLGVEDLKICAQINQSCKQILQNPIFCLSKFEYLSSSFFGCPLKVFWIFSTRTMDFVKFVCKIDLWAHNFSNVLKSDSRKSFQQDAEGLDWW